MIRSRSIFAVTAFCIAAVLGSVQASAGAPVAPSVVTVTEGITVNTVSIFEEQTALEGGGFKIDYSVTNNGPDPIVGFAIDFGSSAGPGPFSAIASATRPGWEETPEVVNRGDWEEGCVILFQNEFTTLTSCDLEESFDEIFPDAEEGDNIAVYSFEETPVDDEFLEPQNGETGGPIENGETGTGFSVEGDVVAASDFIAICFDGQTAAACAFGTATTAVPEPGTLALLGIGLAGIGIARRRRKR